MSSNNVPAARDLSERLTNFLKVDVPAPLQDKLALLQAQRLYDFLPLLCLLVAANAVAMAVAVMGDLPWWQQAAPPVILVTCCLSVLAISRMNKRPTSAVTARQQANRAAWLAGGLGLVAGFWCISAWNEMEQYYCMTAPVFIGIAALVSATCLLSVPKAAYAAMFATLGPITLKLLTYDYTSLRAMAVMLIVVTFMQAGVVHSKFRETIATLKLEDTLAKLAETDVLTGLDNRMAFKRALNHEMTSDRPVVVAIADLDGFKRINDTYGHLAGDTLLAEIGERLREHGNAALSIARLGGDEFALLFTDMAQADSQLKAIRGALALPVAHGEAQLRVGISIGTARLPEDAATVQQVMHLADMRCYEDKAAARSACGSRSEAVTA